MTPRQGHHLSDEMAVARDVTVIGGGPSGMTVALLLARAGHHVTLFEREAGLGGLWASQLDGDGFFIGENSCKVYQSTYHSAPALLRMVGTDWRHHFVPRHDLTREWLWPFVSDCSFADLTKLATAFILHSSGLREYRHVSVSEFLERHRMSDRCQSWMRATALGGIAGTLRMTMWEVFHRLGSSLTSVFDASDGVLHWNAHPPNSPEGFVTAWHRELVRLGVQVELGCSVAGLSIDRESGSSRVVLDTARGPSVADAVFLATPPPALSRLLSDSSSDVADGFGRGREGLHAFLAESMYEHLGMVWFFDRELPNELPLGGHNVRRGWHPILVEHSQYRKHLRPPAVTVVIGSVSPSTDFVHHRSGTRIRDHAPEDLARILWDDERQVDPSLPDPIDQRLCGLSSATQIVAHGPLPIKASTADIYVATSLNGHAPYFTASLESAIQAGAAAAAAFDPSVERLPTASTE